MPRPSTAVSAPGKVLLAGGYLVLDRQYTGLVFGLSARINVVAQEIETSQGVQLTEIVVDSPQFLDAQWRYGYRLAPDDGGIHLTQLQVGSDISPNPFVETTLAYALTYITATTPHAASRTLAPVRLTILADNDYYSQPHDAAPAAGRFAKFPTRLRDAHKTGLGSSAALVTALAAALLAHYLPPGTFDLGAAAGRRALHNLAQAAHCAAQGKVGSGFDVAAAVYGSCRYRRFSPAVLAGVPEPGRPGFAAALAALVRSDAWDAEVDRGDDAAAGRGPVRLPPGVALRMCDVDCGSQTVGMVKQVLAWRAADPAASRALWDELQARNEELAAALGGAAGDAAVAAALARARGLVRAMGAASGVPIEPPSQTALLDALAAGVPGVLGGVVPGAGGFDALALLVRDDGAVEARLRNFLAAWGAEHDARVRLLEVRGETEGARREDPAAYEGWV
ncbi:Phosphomevalonate kinase [Durotheca rogersii]|uniref:Phosphomevalonate kinase n=1 Tax=Durotheca rogersii TaxID=419775 RepID=UPI00221EA460|nr:Phosphomevalonate kinase [Durotheca rogersii]KAI5861596.1 Phosphomevalonate kinase [Durotheca rogersii]